MKFNNEDQDEGPWPFWSRTQLEITLNIPSFQGCAWAAVFVDPVVSRRAHVTFLAGTTCAVQSREYMVFSQYVSTIGRTGGRQSTQVSKSDSSKHIPVVAALQEEAVQERSEAREPSILASPPETKGASAHTHNWREESTAD